MLDTLSKSQRSRVMSRVRGQHTKPEVAVRMLLHRRGLRFRIGGRGLPGKPDIVCPKHGAVIFVHGCFWHMHAGCRGARMPANNTAYWESKLRANRARDKTNHAALKKAGWKVLTVWECEVMKGPNSVVDSILRALNLPLKTHYDLRLDDAAVLKIAEQRSRYLIAAGDQKRRIS